MKIGAHVSAAGGLHNAPRNAAAEGLECFQFFSRPPQGGPPPKLGNKEAAEFRAACDGHGFDEYYVHTPYVINICSAKPPVRKSTVEIIRTDLERASLLGCKSIMTHLGSANGLDEDQAIELAIEGIGKVIDGYDGSARLLLEISAGAGNVIGDSFEELATILHRVEDDRLGVCFDSAHAFASGYDLRTAAAVKNTLSEFDRTIGLDRLELVHLNDSKVELGSHKDRHEHVGQGLIGTRGIRELMSAPALARMNLILETPTDGRADDVVKLKEIREKI
ncbi:MAG: deoxyribonuclease IV [bacterium]